DALRLASATRQPRAPDEIRRSWYLRAFHRLVPPFQPLLQSFEQSLRRAAPLRPEEVDARDFLQLLSSAGETGGNLDVPRPRSNLAGEHQVLGVPFGPRSSDELRVDLPILEARLADPGLSASRARFLRHPLEVFEALLPARQDVDRALQCDCADPGEPLADLRSQVQRLGRELMDEEVPAQR